jgi:hypothetical protein
MCRIHGDVALCGAADVDLSLVSSQEGKRFRDRLPMP